MTDLCQKIEELRFETQTFNKKYFVPEATLFGIVTESSIKDALHALEVPKHEVKDLVGAIKRGARKTFAILLLTNHGAAISRFFRKDSMQESTPDGRLPYSADALQDIFGVPPGNLQVKKFMESQWEFIPACFFQDTIYREFAHGVILPFLDEEPAGDGSMGKAWAITLPHQCHRLPVTDNKVIRKEIQFVQPNKDRQVLEAEHRVFKKELQNLALLTHLEHPNIIKLYCCYVQGKRYNLIFALADQGSINALLDGRGGSESLTGKQLLLGLTDVASAIDAMHNFTSHAYDLNLSGCHHDLAPRNILIHGNTLLLADFGLSTLKPSDDASITDFKNTSGSCIAPECQMLLQGGEFQTGKIGRASDIWSFGCILMESLVYALHGPAGVSDFRRERSVAVTPDVGWQRFHCGQVV
ncbi:hypothetical protein S40293_09969 [Stachybotrys chartarum IBT 40293]|nr:hypothetical protein S40293_09969 [Stachybotrys chartarum IBT 40293]